MKVNEPTMEMKFVDLLPITIRIFIAFVLAGLLARHGIKKKSLDETGAAAAFIVGFISFAVSYRMGLILILFYLSSSRLTKLREEVKRKLEEDYKISGQRNYLQVLTNSFLATVIAIIYYYYCGEDSHVDFIGSIKDGQLNKDCILWCMYIAHYACANGDTWASEVGILSKPSPRLVTTMFTRKVPPGTNGGMSMLGTTASALGGAFIGMSYYLLGLLLNFQYVPKVGFVYSIVKGRDQWPMIVVGLVFGALGSLIDSILGATLQATYFHKEKKCIVKNPTTNHTGSSVSGGNISVELICGIDILSNEAVNFISIAISMSLSVYLSPYIFSMCLL